jgi:diadenosine tetraphosphate (Ap4A) HIT family hydrolase
MSDATGTPPTPEQQLLDEVQKAASAVDDALAHRNEMMRQAESAGIDRVHIWEAAGVL